MADGKQIEDPIGRGDEETWLPEQADEGLNKTVMGPAGTGGIGTGKPGGGAMGGAGMDEVGLEQRHHPRGGVPGVAHPGRPQAARGTRRYLDEQAAEAVETALAGEPSLRDTHIAVDVSDGVVTLAGDVPSADARTRAADLASRPVGVRDVQNQLRVQGH